MKDLKERLLARFTNDGLGDPDDDLINPDGPEAAARITQLEAEIAALREGLERIAAPMSGCAWAATERQEIARALLDQPK